MIFVIDDDRVMAECMARMLKQVEPNLEVQIFSNGIEAVAALNEATPSLIFLDVLLDGPDGFTVLNELASYTDTAKIPVVLVSSLDLQKHDLSNYGIVQVLHKDTMKPADFQAILEQYHGK